VSAAPRATGAKRERIIWIASVLCALFVVGATASHVLQLRRAIQADAQARLLTISRVLAREVNRSLNQTGDLLAQVDATLHGAGAVPAAGLDAHLRAMTRQQPLLREIAVFDRNGRIMASSNPRSIGADVSAFDFVRHTGDGRLHIGLPKAGRDFSSARTGAESAEQAQSGFLTLSFGIPGTDAQRAAVALIGTDSLINELRFLSAVDTERYSLYRYDGPLLATSDPSVIGRTQPHPIFERFLPNRETGSFADTPDGTAQWLAHFDTTPDFPLVVEVRLPQTVVADRWHEELVTPATVLAATLLALALYTRITARALRERAHSQELAATQERRLRNILDTAADGIVTIDSRGTVREYNRAAEAIFGMAAAQAIGRPFASLLPDEHAGEHQGRVERYLRTGRAGVIGRGRTIRTVRADGRPLELNIAVSEVVDQNERLFTGIVRDVTEVRQAEERFRTLFLRSGEPHLLFDASGLIDCNDAAAKLLRAPDRTALRGMRLEQLAPPRQADGDTAALLAAAIEHARREGVERLDWTARALDGAALPVEMTLTPLRLGEQQAMLVGWHDIADRQRYEEGLKQARDAAESAASAKTRFLAMMSHELRTPMTGIIGMVELLRDTPMSDEQRPLVDMLGTSAGGLLTVVNDVLDYSKIEAGRLEFESIDFSPTRLAQEVVDLLSHAASQRGNTLIAEWDEASVPRLRGDPTRLRQVLFNLVGNAIKFTERGTITLAVTARPQPDGRSLLHYEVRDTGVGIASDVLPSLFQPFQQADTSTTRRFGGTGLGLVICRLLATGMGGRIDVASTLGAGSTFAIELPLEPAAGVAPTAPSRDRPVAAPLVTGLQLLVAEDNPTNRLLVGTRLRRAGHEVTLVENGQQAVEAAGARRFDAILMDIQMPVLDGLGATRAIRALPDERARVPIVALTADALPEFRERYLAGGLDDCVTKPIDWNVLDRALLRAAPHGAPARTEAAADGPHAAPAAGQATGLRFDAATVEAMQGEIGADVWRAVLDVYWPKAESDLTACRTAIGAGDPARRSAAAHSLKGASSSLGFATLAVLAAALEHSEPQRAPAAMQALDDAFAQLCADWRRTEGATA